MVTPWWSDDDRFLAALKRALGAAEEVPADFVAAGKAIFTWYDIDAELAALTYDSALDGSAFDGAAFDGAAFDGAALDGAATRGAGDAPPRALIFAAGELTIELEVGQETLLGQVVPARPGTAYTHLVTGDVVASAIDESGCFVFRPAPGRSFRLRCRSQDRTGGGSDVVTGWIAL